MEQKTPVILIRSIDFQRGGITKASIKRANTLAKTFKKVLIVTTLYQPNFQDIVKKFYEQGLLSNNITVINFFNDLKKQNETIFRKKKIKHHIKEKGYNEIRMLEHPEVSYRYYKDGMYVKYKRFDENKNLIFIDYRSNSLQKLKREEYSESGHLSRIRHHNLNYDKPAFDQYFNSNGKCFLSVHINPEKQTEGFTIHFSEETTSYKKIDHLQKIWLEGVLTNFKNPVIMGELRRLEDLIINLNLPNLKKLTVIHSSHLDKPYDDIKKVAPYYNQLFKRFKAFNKIVVLTKEQKRDIISQYEDVDNLQVIPHAYEGYSSENMKESNELYNNDVIMIARYAKAKRIHEAIEAFRYVIDILPNANLYIYGDGPLRNELHKLIKKLKLKKNVFLMGYTENANEQYRNAACSILTSEREGFGMVITESMAEGTPVVSYNIKYGPQDIIEDGVNGFLVEPENKQQLANRIIKILTNNELRQKLSENALEVRNTFSEKKYEKNWVQLIKNI